MKFSVLRRPDKLVLQVPNELLPQFKELVQRATNLWPDASPEIKELADNITNDGVIMQDYSNASVTGQTKFCNELGRMCKWKCGGNQCLMRNSPR